MNDRWLWLVTGCLLVVSLAAAVTHGDVGMFFAATGVLLLAALVYTAIVVLGLRWVVESRRRSLNAALLPPEVRVREPRLVRAKPYDWEDEQ